jgi:DNA-binding response OmpR family regulator
VPEQTILIADNSAPFLATQKEFFERKGYQIITASNPADAKRLIRDKRVNVAMVDLRLVNDTDKKDFSGLDVAKTAKVPVILMSDFPASSEVIRKALNTVSKDKAPVVDFLEKAKDLPEFHELVEKVLTQSHVNKQAIKSGPAEAEEQTDTVVRAEQVGGAKAKDLKNETEDEGRYKQQGGASQSSSHLGDNPESQVKELAVDKTAKSTPKQPDAETSKKEEAELKSALVERNDITEKQGFSIWWRRKSPIIALTALLLALGMGVLAMAFEDPMWLIGTVVGAIFAVAAIGLAIE